MADPPAYVAPARHPLTVLHRPDPRFPPVTDDPDPDGGMTVCGLSMFAEELWVPVERRTGDRVCPACRVPGRAAGYVQEALL